MTEPLKSLVHIVDDDEGIRDSVRMLLYSVGLETVGYVSAADFFARCDLTRPGCLIVDVRMPGMSGLELQKGAAARGIHQPVIILTSHGDIPMAVGALQAGAVDFIEKPYCDQHLIDSVHRAIELGYKRREEGARAAEVRALYDQLTAREREVMQAMVKGGANKVIAAELGISPRTVEIHRGNVMAKFGVHNISELVRLAQWL